MMTSIDGNPPSFLDMDGFLQFLERNGRPLKKKHLDFRRDAILFSSDKYERKAGPVNTPFQVLRFKKMGGQKLLISRQDALDYLKHLKEMSIDITVDDVRTVVDRYGPVLRRARKMGMRAQRNFTGKVEDEVRGKLAEECLSKYLRELSGVELPVFYDLLPSGVLRDEGDFEKVVIVGKHGKVEIPLKPDMIIAVKSTNGFFPFAIPENEWGWPGQIYIAVRPHIDDDFLLYFIEKGLGIPNAKDRKVFGWLEIEGWVSKDEMHEKGFVGNALPGGYHMGDPWPKRNLIMHPLQLHRTRPEMQELMSRYRELGENV